jgi:hypothetical protein
LLGPNAYFRIMKTIFSLLLLLPAFSFAQDSCKLKKDRDPYTKEVRISTGFITLGDHKVTIDANSKEIDIFFTLGSTKDGICFDDKSTMNATYAGGKLKTTFRSSGTMNCEGYYHVTFRNQHSPNYNLQKLMTQKVGSFAFINGKTTTTVTLDEETQLLFQKAVTCLVNEAKTLILTN